MQPTDPLRNELRRKIGEVIPAGGSDADTLFPNEAIDLWLTEASSMNHAALEGWEAKLAEFSSLVDVTDGAAMRKLSDLMEHAEKMRAIYLRKVGSGPTDTLARTRTRIGKIIRHG